MDSISERSEVLPVLIQGGMGVAVSSWQLAREVSLQGHLGVVSGTALDAVLVRRLQQGDPAGHLRRAFNEFPFPEMAERIWQKYFIPGGKDDSQPFSATMAIGNNPKPEHVQRIVLANFVEVFLAKEGHQGLIGINLLEKIQTPTLPSLYGAMLARVDYVLMGAGIPRLIPGVLDAFSEGESAQLPLYVEGATTDHTFFSEFSPAEFTDGEVPWLNRPKFLAIVSSATLASMLARKSNGRVDGFVVEGPTAGGHNAPPRGRMELNERGEPIYGQRDEVDLQAFRELNVPFWLAGSFGSAEQVDWALSQGATGVQVGTAFAFCQESGIDPALKQTVIQLASQQRLTVFTDPLASPTGFPFKVLDIEETLSDSQLYQQRERRCDLGYLRQGYLRPDGQLGWRCPGEPVDQYLKKGGKLEDTIGRKCVCNGLMSTVGLAQSRQGDLELPLITCGNDISSILSFLPFAGATSYSAQDVINCLLKNCSIVID